MKAQVLAIDDDDDRLVGLSESGLRRLIGHEAKEQRRRFRHLGHWTQSNGLVPYGGRVEPRGIQSSHTRLDVLTEEDAQEATDIVNTLFTPQAMLFDSSKPPRNA